MTKKLRVANVPYVPVLSTQAGISQRPGVFYNERFAAFLSFLKVQ